MSRSPIDRFYLRRLADLAEAGCNCSQIARQLEQEAKEAGRADWPSYRTVARYVKAIAALPPAERRQQQPYRWPAAHEDGTLPWEAAPAALELARYFRQRAPKMAPSTRHAKWFWRLRLAAPTAPVDALARWSWLLASAEYERALLGARAYSLDTADLEQALASGEWDNRGFRLQATTPEAMVRLAEDMAAAGFGTIVRKGEESRGSTPMG